MSKQDKRQVVFITDAIPMKVEALTDKKYRFSTVGSVANVINGNNRIIPSSVQMDAVEDWKQHRWQLTSYIGHPRTESNEDIRGDMRELAGVCDIIELNAAGETIVNITPLESTDEGRKIKGMFDEGVEIGVSQRALGIQSVREDEAGEMFIVVDKIVRILGYDFCLLDSAAAGDRTKLRLLDTVELNRIVNSKRIEDQTKEEGSMDELVKQNKALIESVTALVDAIQAKMAGDSNELPKEIVDSFDALKGGVEKLKADSTMDEVKKNAHLLKVSDSLKAIVDSIVPKQAEATTEKKDDKPEAGAVQDTVVVEKKDDKPEVDAAAVQAAEQAVTTLTDSAARLTAFVATETKRRADEAHAAEMGKYLLDTVAALDVAEDVKKQVTEALTGKAFEAKENVHTAIADVMKLVNLGVAQERLKNEGIKGKGTAMADVILKSEHLKGVEILTDQILATGMIGSKRESMIDGKDRSHVVRAFLKIFDTIHGANLKAEAEKLASLMDATQTPADFQVPYTISRIVLEEVYSDYMIEKLTDFGPMAAKRDSIPITRYRREGGFATTQFTRKPTNARISELKPGEFGTMAKGKLLTEWFDIDATATKLQAAFSDEFATLSKRTPNITGVSRGIANLIQDLRRSLQQMVFNDMRNSAMAYGSLAFTYNATGDGAHSLYTAVTGASISFGDALTVKVNDVAIKEYEVSATGNLFYVVDAPNGKIQFVDAEGKAANITDTHAIVVTGKKVTNEVRFSLTVDTGYTWERWMNKLLFAVGNQVAAHRQNRGYKPEFLLTSEVTANYMSQAEAYAAQAKRNGFTADSIVGEGDYGRVANLPLFGSDVWDDAYILATQKDATIFRIFEPLILKGPYPTRDTNGGLTGGDEYYVYQEDSLITPLKEKMSLITVIA